MFTLRTRQGAYYFGWDGHLFRACEETLLGVIGRDRMTVNASQRYFENLISSMISRIFI